MLLFTLPSGEAIETTATDYCTKLIEYFRENNHHVVDAGRGNPGGYAASQGGLQAGIDYLSSHSPEGSGYGGSHYAHSDACAANLNKILGTKDYFKKDGLLFSTGEVEALNALSRALRGTRIITPYPHYVNYEKIFSGTEGRAELVPVLPEDNDTFSAIGAAVRSERNASAILICDPHNPTGAKLSADEWRRLFKIIKERPAIKLVLDFAYYGISNDWEGPQGQKKLAIQPLQIMETEFPEIKDRIVTLFSCTKVGGLFDERPAVSFVPDKKLQTKMNAEKTFSTFETSPTTVAICSGILNDLATSDRLSEMSYYYGERAKMIESTLQDLGVLVNPWQGSLYVTADLSGLYGAAMSDKAAAWTGHTTIDNDFDIMASLAYPKDPSQVGVLTSIVDPMRNDTGLIRFCVGIKEMDDIKELQSALQSIKSDLKKADKSEITGYFDGFNRNSTRGFSSKSH